MEEESGFMTASSVKAGDRVNAGGQESQMVILIIACMGSALLSGTCVYFIGKIMRSYWRKKIVN